MDSSATSGLAHEVDAKRAAIGGGMVADGPLATNSSELQQGHGDGRLVVCIDREDAVLPVPRLA